MHRTSGQFHSLSKDKTIENDRTLLILLLRQIKKNGEPILFRAFLSHQTKMHRKQKFFALIKAKGNFFFDMCSLTDNDRLDRMTTLLFAYKYNQKFVL